MLSNLLSLSILSKHFQCFFHLNNVNYHKIEINYSINKMYCVQNRIYCSVCHISVLVENYLNHLKTQGHINNNLEKPM